MLGNILQLTGAVVTLVLILLLNPRFEWRRMFKFNEKPTPRQELYRLIEQRVYAIVGAFLIVIGYIVATVKIDFSASILIIIAKILLMIYGLLFVLSIFSKFNKGHFISAFLYVLSTLLTIYLFRISIEWDINSPLFNLIFYIFSTVLLILMSMSISDFISERIHSRVEREN